jgi:hypothetical protein
MVWMIQTALLWLVLVHQQMMMTTAGGFHIATSGVCSSRTAAAHGVPCRTLFAGYQSQICLQTDHQTSILQAAKASSNAQRLLVSNLLNCLWCFTVSCAGFADMYGAFCAVANAPCCSHHAATQEALVEYTLLTNFACQ